MSHEKRYQNVKTLGVMMDLRVEKSREIERKYFRKVIKAEQKLQPQGILKKQHVSKSVSKWTSSYHGPARKPL